MDFTRRDLVKAMGATTAIAASISASACSLPPQPFLEVPGRLLSKVSKGLLIEAKAFIEPNATLSISSSIGGQLIVGADEVLRYLNRLLTVEGYSMVGDTRDEKYGGMYWRDFGMWTCSDMIKGTAVELGICGDGLMNRVFNVFADVVGGQAAKVRSILLLESNNLMSQMGFEPINFPINK